MLLPTFLNQCVGELLLFHTYVFVVLGICKEALSASGQDIYLEVPKMSALEKLAWLQPHWKTSWHSPGLADVVSCFPYGKLYVISGPRGSNERSARHASVCGGWDQQFSAL